MRPLVIVTGPPGAGKTAVSRLLALRFEPSACVLESDWWWTTIVTGHVPPWRAEADRQNRTVIRSCVAAARAMVEGGYATVLDGVVGPWMLDLVSAERCPEDMPVHYVVLRPELEVAVARATARAGEERVAGHPALTDEEPIRQMWHAFQQLGAYEQHALDSTGLDAQQTANDVWSLVQQGALRLPPASGE